MENGLPGHEGSGEPGSSLVATQSFPCAKGLALLAQSVGSEAHSAPHADTVSVFPEMPPCVPGLSQGLGRRFCLSRPGETQPLPSASESVRRTFVGGGGGREGLHPEVLQCHLLLPSPPPSAAQTRRWALAGLHAGTSPIWPHLAGEIGASSSAKRGA